MWAFIKILKILGGTSYIYIDINRIWCSPGISFAFILNASCLLKVHAEKFKFSLHTKKPQEKATTKECEDLSGKQLRCWGRKVKQSEFWMCPLYTVYTALGNHWEIKTFSRFFSRIVGLTRRRPQPLATSPFFFAPLLCAPHGTRACRRTSQLPWWLQSRNYWPKLMFYHVFWGVVF